MKNTQKAYIQLHVAVILFGFTAILGDLITLSALILVWWRVLITSVSLLFFIEFGKKLMVIPKKRILQFMGIGVLVALHWICFFGSIKYANASVCLVCFATTSFFTSFLEPILTKRPFRWHEMSLGIIVIPGMILIVNNVELTMMLGVWIGLAAAFLASLFAIFNKQLVNEADSFSITFLELGSAWIFISLILPFYFINDGNAHFFPNLKDVGYLIVLALLCTTFAYVIALKALKYVSAFAANLTLSLEPVYGIILAIFILKENKELDIGFYFGSALILLSVLIYPVIKKYFEKHAIDKN
jgi:drug/metabolite transporter (DMT)-like permease